MESPIHAYCDLFRQLGLPSDPAAIEAFITDHRPLPHGTRLADAPWWSVAQAQLLREKLADDADWAELVDSLDARFLVVSFNDEGYVSELELREILGARGPVAVLRVDCARYVGAKIGIYNPAGEKIGRVSHVRNQELIFVVACGAELPRGILERAEQSLEPRLAL